MRFFAFILAMFLAMPASVKAADTVAPNVEIWLPPDFREKDGPWPLLVFSHSFGGCAVQSVFLTKHLAEQGYIVAAPDHDDARPCNGSFSGALRRQRPVMPEQPFRHAQVWSDETDRDRRDDVLFTVKSLLDDPQYGPYIDKDRMGLLGHSLGGYTALGLAGAWPSWKDDRFKAILVLSPYMAPYIVHDTIGNVTVPVMYQGGTRDEGFTPLMKSQGYPRTGGPKYLVELAGADHMSWTELDTRFVEEINQTAVAFFDFYLKSKGAEPKKPESKKITTFWKENPKE